MESAPEHKKAAPAEKSDIDNLALIIRSVNRITARLESRPAFKEASFTLSDWLLLNAMKQEGTAALADVARAIGFNKTRVYEQSIALQQAGFVVVTKPEPGVESKVKVLSLTPEGKQLMEKIDVQMLEAISGEKGGDISQPLRGASRALSRIVRGIVKLTHATES